MLKEVANIKNEVRECNRVSRAILQVVQSYSPNSLDPGAMDTVNMKANLPCMTMEQLRSLDIKLSEEPVFAQTMVSCKYLELENASLRVIKVQFVNFFAGKLSDGNRSGCDGGAICRHVRVADRGQDD